MPHNCTKWRLQLKIFPIDLNNPIGEKLLSTITCQTLPPGATKT